MCGRYTLRSNPVKVAEQFGLFEVPPLALRFNIAPSQAVAAVVAEASTKSRRLRTFSWGFVPEWSENPDVGMRPINARSETAAEKPFFRMAMRRRRCLIPADGFYEWQADGRDRQPFHFRLRGGEPFAFAGLYEEWRSPDRALETCTILTTAANSLLREFHERMPVILAPNEYAQWLDPDCDDVARVQPLLDAYPAEGMEHWPVSRAVNGTKRDDESCVKPYREPRLFD